MTQNSKPAVIPYLCIEYNISMKICKLESCGRQSISSIVENTSFLNVIMIGEYKETWECLRAEEQTSDGCRLSRLAESREWGHTTSD